MALPESYQWTPSNNGTAFPHSSHVNSRDLEAEAQREHEQALLVWGLSIAVVFLLLAIGGTIWFRRVAAAKESERLSRLFAPGPIR